MYKAVDIQSRFLAFHKNARRLLQYLFILLLSVSAFTYAEVAVDEEVSPWQLSIVGASTGDVLLRGDEQALSLGISEVCVAESQISEEFSSSSSEDLSLLGFQSFGSEALSLLNERATVTAQAVQVLLAPTVLSDSDEITLSAFINSATDSGAGTDSLSIYLTDNEYVGYGVQYQGDGTTGIWALIQFNGADSQSNLAEVAATDNHPTTGQTVTLKRSGDTLTVTVGGTDIGLSYTVNDGIDNLSRYGMRSTSLEASDNNYLDDLTLTFPSNATCPALADTGEWDDAYSLHFVYQELLQQGELIARLSSHSNSGSGIAGIALRNGTAATDKAIALVMDPADNSIGLFTRDTDDAASILTSTGQTGALPQWLRLVRDGDTITAYISTDGESWTQVDSVSISFDDIIKAGIAVAVTGSEAQTLEYDNLSVVNELSGDITSDLELAAHQTYVVTGNVDVNSGVTLTINEGATILFDGNFKIEVNGHLTASGGEYTPVVFTSAQVAPAKGDWYGLVVNSGGSLDLSNTTIEYAVYGLYAKSGSVFSLSNSTLQYFDESGIYAYSASGLISNNTIQYADVAGVYLYGVADVTVSDNAITDNQYGFYIKGYSGIATTPTITGNTVTDNSSYGFYLYGVRSADYDPQPVITGNNIYSNSGYDLYTYYYESGALNIDASGNWWNTTDPESIAAEIFDYTDSTSYRPIVDYSGYLDAEGGTAAVSYSLLGYLTRDTTLVAGATYTLLSTVHVQSGVTLTIEPGARVEVGDNFRLKVSGNLDAKGTSDSPIVFTSDESEPSVGDWYGIVAESGGTVTLDYVNLEYGDYGLYAGAGSTFSLSNSTLQYFDESAVYAYNASGSISNNVIQHADVAGVYLYGVSDTTVSGNTITDNYYGFYIRGYSGVATTPAITGNTITGNSRNGFYLHGAYTEEYDPQPVITGNTIHSNSNYDLQAYYYESGALTVDATGNWWNTTDTELIAAEVYDYSDSTTYRPLVDYSGYLDSEGGSEAISNGLIGFLAEDTTLLADTTYTLLGTVYVQNGVTLTIEPGARIEVGGNFSLKVSGTLDAQGTSESPIVFTSDESEPSVGDWYGIVAESGGTVILDYVTLEYGDYGLYADAGSTFSLSNSILQYFDESAVYAYSASGSINNNIIQDADVAGVYLYGVTNTTVSNNSITDSNYGFYIRGYTGVSSTPAITGNTITGNNYGFYIQGYSGGTTTPTITGNTITGNSIYGFYLYGVRNAEYDPQPVITGNSIHSNNNYDLHTYYYESGVLTINATGNWWNTTDSGEIGTEVYDYSDSTTYRPLVDYSGYLDAEGGSAAISNGLNGYLTEDTTLVAGTTYTLLNTLYVQNGVTLTIEAGARIEVGGNFSLKVSGTLDAQGTSESPIVFTSDESEPSVGDWYGIVAESGGTVILDYVTLEYGDYGLYAGAGSTFSLTNSTLQHFDESAVYAYSASGSISNNIIQDADVAGVYLYGVTNTTVSNNSITDSNYGFYIRGYTGVSSTPAITGNTITGNNYGFYIQGYSGGTTTPTITGNTITGNSSYGFYLYGVRNAEYDPQPVITGNSIHSNNNYDLHTYYYESGVLTVNATGNWWNTTNAGEIGAEVYDYSDNTSYRPLVDYSGYLDTEGGSAAISNGLNGYLTEDTTLVAGTTYTLLSTLYVQSGITLTIEPGARIEVGDNFSLKVFGTLDAQGTSESPIVFTSDESEPSVGDWYGIVAESGSTVILDYVTLEYGDYGLYAGAGSTFSLTNSTLQYFDESAVYAYNASGSISANAIQHADIAGVYLYGVADVSVSDNTITDNAYGFYIKGYSGIATTPTITGNTVTGNSSYGFYIRGYNGGTTAPTITGNTITGNSSYGFYLYGVYNAEYDPQPVITGNNIHGNGSYDLYTAYYEKGVLTVNATGNWWNTTNSGEIGAQVYDYSDNTYYRPLVDYSGYLDAEGGSVAISNDLSGYLTEDTTLLAGTTYTIVNSVYVQSGVTLTIEPGARIEAGDNFSLKVSGTLDAQGTSDSPIVFTSDEGEPSVGDWYGIVVENGGTATLDHVTLEYGDYGLYANSGSAVSLSNSTLQYFDESGVYAYNASGSINNNTIQYADVAGVYLYGVANATVSNNAITHNYYGFYIKGYNGTATTPAITGNTITDNSNYGFYLYGVYNAEYDPQPVITGNNIHDNGSYELHTAYYENGVLTINATGNWWNTIDSGEIGDEVYDYNDSAYYRPLVDYSGYLDAEGGRAAISNSLNGYLNEDTTLLADTTYTILSTVYVQSGVTLTIEPGARIEVGGNFSLKVSGTLKAQGTSDSPIVFTSDESEPSVGDWHGIVAESGGTVTLDYVTLEYGDYGLYAGSGSTFNLSNSTLQYFDESAVYAYKASGSISNNIIQQADVAGVYLYGVADVTVSDNAITHNYYGFYIKGYSGVSTNPTITSNIVTDNSRNGFYLYGVYNSEYDPQPVITGNSIHSNTNYDLEAYYYESGVLTLNATGNWWNTTDSEAIAAEVYDYTDSTSYRPLVDYSGYLDSESGSAAVGDVLNGYLTEDTTLVTGTTYTLLSTVYVQSGVTLTIEPGARIEVGGNFSLNISGTLDAQGTSDSPIVFTSDESEPTAGDWYGIVAETGGTVTLDYVTLEYGDYGLYADSGSTFSLSNSTLRYFDESGVYAYNASGLINNNTIQYAGVAGVYLYGVGDVTAADNLIADNYHGFYIRGYSGLATVPTITGNTITGNSYYGFYLYGTLNETYDPQPVITGNSIYSNNKYEFYTYYYESGVLTVNATGNWWNTTDSGEIGAEVYDYSDSTTYRPLVDYSGYLDAEGGSAAISNGLNGYLTEDTTLVAGTTYTLLSTLYVQSGVTLTIEPGARIEVGGDFSLKVSGTLDAQGTSESPIVFTSDESEPSVGDWYGIVAESGGTVILDYVTLEYGDYGLYAGAGSTFSLTNSTLQYFDESAIYAYSASGSISNNIIQDADVAGVYLYGVTNTTVSNNSITDSNYGFYIRGYTGVSSTPAITGNTITGNNYGFYIQGYSGGTTTPTITGNTITDNSIYGFYLYGVRNAEYDPQPVITDNSIHSNNNYDLHTYYYESGVLSINATGNWWNTTDSGEIGAEVYDYSDNTSYRPLVDYSGYLDAEGGSAAISNGLNGYLTEDTTLVAGTTYTLLNTLYVQSGVTLTIEPGARIEVGGDFSLKVSGTLDAQGTSESPIVFTSDESEPSVGDWYGIVAESGGTVILDYVTLEYGDYGLYAGAGSTFSLTNSTLQYFDESAVYAYNASGSISANAIQHADIAGVYLYGVADVSVSDNTITDNRYGFYIKGYSGIATTPTITGNTITGNSIYGFYLYGVRNAEYDPQPVITGNSIHSNNNYDLHTYYYESGVLTINATGNWWNTTDSGEIGTEVYDYSDSTTYRPLVDYSGYLDAEGGSAAISNGLNGYLTEDTTLVAGTTYTLLNTLYVQNGVTLTIEAGARIEVGGNFSLKVSGTLDAQGTSESPIVFTSDESEPSVGDWYGIVAESGGTVILDYVTLEYGDYGLYAGAGSTFSLTNSTLQYFDESAVYAYSASGSISNNIIQDADVAGVYLYGVTNTTVSNNSITDSNYGFYIRGYTGVSSTPAITGNTITGNNYGFYIQGYSGGTTTPTITGNTITGNSSYGFYLYGVRNAEYDPQPVITGNSIHSNNNYDLHTYYYESGVLTVNATGNWWNTTNAGEIGAEVYDYSDNTSYRPLVDYSGYLDTEGGSAAISNGLNGYLTEDTTLVAGTTYTLLSTLYVQSGITLTIEPGARIEVGDNFSLKVFGTLDAQGTSESPIVFTSDESEPSVGDWYGIVAESGSTVILDYVTLEYGDYGLYAGAGSTFSLTNSTLQYFDESAVYAYNASGSISANAIQHADIAGVYLYGVADVSVSDNTITDNAYGFYIKGYSGIATTPTITGNTITGNSIYGFYLYGVRNAEYDPQPVITGNSIHSNNNYDLHTYYYESGVLTINATGNWWNTTDSGEIGTEVYDYSDSTTYRPLVDYSGYLDTEGGSAAISNGLNGYLTEDTTLVAGTTYTLLSTLYVQSGVTLTIEPGARIEVGDNFSLKVFGTLDAQGTSESPIVFTSDESEPSVGDWYGIVAESGGTVILDYVTLEYGDYGLYAGAGSTFSLTNSTLQYFDESAVYAYNASGSISANAIQHADIAGVYLYGVADVSVSDNTITDNTYGFYIKGYSGIATTPTITGNTITGNSIYGFYLYGVRNAEYDPQPVITGNSIHSNNNYDLHTYYYESGVLTINATGNWWNTIESGSIAEEIYDYTDSTSYRPLVDYSGYLDGANGNSVYDHYLRFDIDSDTTLAAGSYVVVDDINVNSGVSLSIEAGAILVFSAGYSLTVEGDLVVSGSSSQPVLFTSEAQYPAAGDWQGIVVASGGSVSIDNAYVQYAETAVSATSPSAFSVTNSILTDFSESGIGITNFDGGTIANNLIQNADYTATGIALDTASPAVTDNIVTGLNYGAYITGASSPSLTGNSFINNNYGIYLNGSGSDATNPTPTIIGNDLYGNANGSLYLNNYGSSSAVVLNVTGNWWGSAAPEWGVDIIGVDSPETAVDYSNALATEIRAITSNNLSGNYEYFSPNSDGNQDTLAIAATLSSSSSWSLEVSSESGTVVNSFSGTGTDISIDWDGSDSSSTLLSDGRYYLFLKVTDAENTSYRAGAIWVELDNTAPTVEMSNINDGDTLSTGTTKLEIEGSATDSFFVDYTMDYQLSSDVDNWVSLESSTAAVSESTLAEWIVSSTDGTVEAPANGEYQVRLVASDRAGNISTIIRTVTLDLISIANVSRNQTTVNPVAGESLVISFDLSVGATVTLDIKDEQTGVLIRSVVETFDSAGSHSLSWDGKDAEGNYAQEEAYTYDLTAVNGSVEGVYTIEDGGSSSDILLGSMDATMNAAQNDFMKAAVTPTSNVRV
ncbi:right-handed parallel beta-helix repeat-containing protein [Microbulbifer sp. SSSA002]|uniref:right-handed parallel beta-helix repeat-containing protein n=1 Tax=Microbulbifer sp. SSSA002 TaxID=3243376 RepID=UPI004038FE30